MNAHTTVRTGRSPRAHAILVLLLAASITVACVSAPAPAHAPRPTGIDEPGGDAEGASQAMFSPEDYAWTLFFFLNHQAANGAPGVADPTKPTIRDYDPGRPVVWQTWALSSSGADGPSEMLLKPAVQPPAWEDLPRGPVTGAGRAPAPPGAGPARGIGSERAPPDLSETGDIKNSLFQAHPATGAADAANPPAAGNGALEATRKVVSREESRVNRALYETVVSHDLYSIDGIERAISAARAQGRTGIVDFPRGSKAVKAHWEKVTDTSAESKELSEYHCCWITNKLGKKEAWKLVALHITTKDLPNWFWCTFEHEDVSVRAEIDNRIPESGPRAGTEGSKWSHYRLRGTQTEFVNAAGVPSKLSNPSIESSFQHSSCIACHACAGAGLRSELWPNSTLAVSARENWDRPAGLNFESRRTCLSPPNAQQDFFINNRQVYFHSDFVWTFVVRAYPRQLGESLPDPSENPDPIRCHGP